MWVTVRLYFISFFYRDPVELLSKVLLRNVSYAQNSGLAGLSTFLAPQGHKGILQFKGDIYGVTSKWKLSLVGHMCCWAWPDSLSVWNDVKCPMLFCSEENLLFYLTASPQTWTGTTVWWTMLLPSVSKHDPVTRIWKPEYWSSL